MSAEDDEVGNMCLASDAPQPRPFVEALAFDAWLRRNLAERFDPALQEPLPDELLTLLDPSFH